MMRTAVPTSRPPLRFGAGLSRHFVTLNPLMPSAWWAFAFAFLLVLGPTLAANIIGQPGILLFLAATGLMVVLFPNLVVQSTARNGLLWAFPAWTILSIAWSTAQDRTIHGSLLVLPTVIAGTTLGGMEKRREVNLGAAAAMLVFVAASLAAGGRTLFSDTGSGGEALTGFGSGKNFFGHLAAMSAILSFSFFSFTGTRFGRILTLVGLGDLAMSTFALVGSHASGSLVAFALATAVLVVVVIFTRVPWQMRILSLALLLGLAIMYMAFGQEIQQMLFDTILSRFNKDSSLTGRTMLWDYADRLMPDHRLLGYGSGAFWTFNNPDAWTLWRMMGLPPGTPFNFHNTPRDTLIETGLIGFVIYVASFGGMFVRTFWSGLLRGDLASAVRVAFIAYFVVRMPIETTGFGAASADGILLVAFLSTTVRPGKGTGAERQARIAVARPPVPARGW